MQTAIHVHLQLPAIRHLIGRHVILDIVLQQKRLCCNGESKAELNGAQLRHQLRIKRSLAPEKSQQYDSQAKRKMDARILKCHQLLTTLTRGFAPGPD